MNAISRELEELLRESGADLVGFADLRGVAPAGRPEGEAPAEPPALPCGVAVAIALPPGIIRSLCDGPNPAYYDMYHAVNARLNSIVTAGAEYLAGKGYRARAQTTTAVVESGDHRTALPHKTVATRAGLGWIGKCALLVTPVYGSAVRISSLVTDAPLDCGRPVDESRCGSCEECVAHCPARAVTGALWSAGLPREALLDARKCHDTARALSAERIGKAITLCGRCIEVCPYTRRYLRGAGRGRTPGAPPPGPRQGG